MQIRVWASGIVFNPEQAELFAIHLGHTRSSLCQLGVTRTLNSYFAHHGWNTACRPVERRDGSPGFLVITNFAVVRPGAPMPQLAGDAWSRRVREALLTPRLREDYPFTFDWVDSGRYRLAKEEVPPFILALFKRQRKGERITSLSPDQTDYSQWETKPKKSVSQSSSSSSESSSSTTSHNHTSSSDSDCASHARLRQCEAGLASTPTPPLPSHSTASARPKRGSAKIPRAKGSRAPRGSSADSSQRVGVSVDDDDGGYEADVGYESTDTIRG